MSGHTPGPWRQGETLLTAQTERWTEKQWAENDSVERLAVFAYFTSVDQGRGRQRVATCTREEDARLIAAAPDLLGALQRIAAIENQMYGGDWDEIEEARLIAITAIAKATGQQP